MPVKISTPSCCASTSCVDCLSAARSIISRLGAYAAQFLKSSKDRWHLRAAHVRLPLLARSANPWDVTFIKHLKSSLILKSNSARQDADPWNFHRGSLPCIINHRNLFTTAACTLYRKRIAANVHILGFINLLIITLMQILYPTAGSYMSKRFRCRRSGCQMPSRLRTCPP